MAVFTKVDINDAKALLKNYDLGELLDLRGISAGIENTNYFLDTTTGSYVLTIFEVLTFEQLPFYIGFMKHLSARGLLVPEPQVDHQGQMIGVFKNKPFVIATKLKGQYSPLPSVADCQLTATIQAQIHIAGKDYSIVQKNLRGLSWWQEKFPEIKPFLTAEQLSMYESLLEEQIEFHQSDIYQSLPEGPCHCDLFRDNVLIDGDQMGGVIDFYFAGVDKFLFDVAVSVNDWCIDRDKQNNPTALNLEKVNVWLQAYERVRPFTPEEKEVWPLMLKTAGLRFWTSRLYDYYLPRPADDLKPHDPTWFEHLLKNRMMGR
ncbi:homoserine kinase [Basilea psittacipulmonis]|uniref:Homoserine kinase n=1 Tax=Basilea psittacipulmonis DSM 24701 TaxID=1072685 RepID=A0A077DG58_9BURK|nr:homoserine kinase [Basilea psittacipulmonis]AIL33161.1 serine kinase [Basilea psittacipulmonis DSM 24701]